MKEIKFSTLFSKTMKLVHIPYSNFVAKNKRKKERKIPPLGMPKGAALSYWPLPFTRVHDNINPPKILIESL